MGADFFDLPTSIPALAEIQGATGIDVPNLCLNSDAETLTQTQNAQIALYTCGVLAFLALDMKPDSVAGHSIGEYAALVAGGVLSIADGARLVRRRGDLMAAAPPGGMAAILGLDREPLEAACKSVNQGVVVIANDNCPGQLVISGDKDAVAQACEKAKAAGAKRAMPLHVSGAFHSPLMDDSAREMRKALDQVEFRKSAIPVYSNVLAAPHEDPAGWPGLLELQLKSPVLWTETLRALAGSGVNQIIECGSGEVLCGLAKRTVEGVSTWAVHDTATLAAASSLRR
jgi:[acyl-carrier-protein] S-malonyltransferase